MICPACLYVQPGPRAVCVACGRALAEAAEGPGPFVGRGRALAWLDDQLETVLKTHRPRFVGVTGQPGAGRSRLLEAFRQRHDNAFSDVEVLHGFPVQRAHAGDPFRPFGRLLHMALGLDERMAPEVRLARLTAAVRALKPPAEAEALQGLAAVLGLSLAASVWPAPDACPAAAHAAVRWYLAARATRTPLIVLLEGMDAASADGRRLYAELREGLDHGRILVVLEASPGGAGMLGVSPAGLLALPPLDRAGVGELLMALTGRASPPPAALLDAALVATGGLPKGVREVARALTAAGLTPATGLGWGGDADHAAILAQPLTAQQAALAGVTALPAATQAVLSHAAFVGPVSWVGAVVASMRVGAGRPAPGTWPDSPSRAAIDAALTAAAAAGVVERRADADLPGEPAWGFVEAAVHAAVRQAHRLEPTRPRHRIVAAWLAGHHRDASPVDLLVLGEHHEAGGAPGRAADAWREAGRRLAQAHAVDEAIAAYDRALAALEPTAAQRRLEVHHALGVLHDLAGRPTVSDACFEAMLADAWALDHRAKAGAALNRLGRSLRRQSRHADAERLLAAGRALFEAAGDGPGVAASVDDLGQVALLRGDLEAAVGRFREALEARRAAGDERGVALSLTNIGRAMREAGDLVGAEDALQQAAALRTGLNDLPGLIDTALTLAELRLAQGRLESAAEAAASALGDARRIASTSHLARALAVSALLVMARTGAPEAAHMAHEALGLAEQIGDAPTAARALRALALTAAEAAPGNALGHLARAIQRAERHGDRFELAACLRMAVSLHLRLADVDVQGRSAEARSGASLAPLDPVALEHLREASEALVSVIDVLDAVHDAKASSWARRALARVHEARGNLAHGAALRAEAATRDAEAAG